MPRVQVFPAVDFPSEYWALWANLQRSSSIYDNPFFRPEFTQAVATVRDNVEIAVLFEGERVIGFFPFERFGKAVGRPVGGVLNYLHGPIVEPQATWTMEELVRGCRLKAWDFLHLPVSIPSCARYHRRAAGSPYVDVSRGFATYCEEHRRNGHKRIPQAFSRYRKLEREVPPVRFEYHTVDMNALDKMAEWKSAQYQRTHETNIFAMDWVIQLLRRILMVEPTEAFAPVLSVLYAAEQPIAVSFAISSYRVQHGWHTGYDPAFATYSPGLNMLLKMAEAAAERGIDRIDLARGEQDFKQSLMSGETMVAEGAVDFSPLRVTARKVWRGFAEAVHGSRFAAPIDLSVRWIRQWRELYMFR